MIRDVVGLILAPGMHLTMAVALIAGLVRGFAGFGGALIYVPVAAAALGPAVAGPSLLLFDGFGTLPNVFRAWRSANWRLVLPLIVGAVTMVPVGATVLKHVDPTAVRWFICAVIFVVVAALASGLKWPGPPKTPVSFGVGLVAGFLGGLAQISGPPVVIYMLGRSMAAADTRANLFVLFAVSSVATFITYLVTGILTSTVVLTAIMVGPFYVAGVWTGAFLFGKAPERFYRRLAFVLIIAAGIAGMPIFQG